MHKSLANLASRLLSPSSCAQETFGLSPLTQHAVHRCLARPLRPHACPKLLYIRCFCAVRQPPSSSSSFCPRGEGEILDLLPPFSPPPQSIRVLEVPAGLAQRNDSLRPSVPVPLAQQWCWCPVVVGAGAFGAECHGSGAERGGFKQQQQHQRGDPAHATGQD